MIQTDKVIDWYEDEYGNEVDIYEEIEKYTVCYNGSVFVGDDENGWNEFNTDSFKEAIGFYNTYSDVMDVYIQDNEYGIIYQYGDWY